MAIWLLIIDVYKMQCLHSSFSLSSKLHIYNKKFFKVQKKYFVFSFLWNTWSHYCFLFSRLHFSIHGFSEIGMLKWKIKGKKKIILTSELCCMTSLPSFPAGWESLLINASYLSYFGKVAWEYLQAIRSSSPVSNFWHICGRLAESSSRILSQNTVMAS